MDALIVLGSLMTIIGGLVICTFGPWIIWDMGYRKSAAALWSCTLAPALAVIGVYVVAA